MLLVTIATIVFVKRALFLSFWTMTTGRTLYPGPCGTLAITTSPLLILAIVRRFVSVQFVVNFHARRAPSFGVT